MANLIFQKKHLKEDEDIYAIKHVGGPHIEKVVVGDEVTFKRTGKHNNWGFKITFNGVGAPDPIEVKEDLSSGAGPSEVDWPVPDKVGEWKYDVEFPYDESQGHIVASCDPIIIINPSFSSSSSLLRDAAVFVVGLVAGVVAVQMFF